MIEFKQDSVEARRDSSASGWTAMSTALVGLGEHLFQLDGCRIRLPGGVRKHLHTVLSFPWMISFCLSAASERFPWTCGSITWHTCVGRCCKPTRSSFWTR